MDMDKDGLNFFTGLSQLVRLDEKSPPAYLNHVRCERIDVRPTLCVPPFAKDAEPRRESRLILDACVHY